MNTLNKQKIEPSLLPLHRPRQSGVVLKLIDTDVARAALRRMSEESDAAECQQTLQELMQALNETRAEADERLLFS